MPETNEGKDEAAKFFNATKEPETNAEFVKRVRTTFTKRTPLIDDVLVRLETADKKIEQQQTCVRELKELVNEAQCPDILHCDKGWITNTFNNERSHCVWCKKRRQAIAKAEEMLADDA